MSKENKNEVYGVIHEVGDLNLGFTELSEEDQKKIKDQNEKK